jgi:hypothetical protein
MGGSYDQNLPRISGAVKYNIADGRMTDEEPSDSGKQLKCTLSPMTVRYLEALSKRGLD